MKNVTCFYMCLFAINVVILRAHGFSLVGSSHKADKSDNTFSPTPILGKQAHINFYIYFIVNLLHCCRVCVN